MIEKKNLSLSVDEIMNKIKEEVENHEFLSPTIQQKNIPSGKMKNKHFKQKDHYKIIDFTKFNDITFIENVYRGVLMREPDADGVQIYLNLLRSGNLSKGEILTLLRFSKEGRSKNVNIEGIKKRFFIYSLYRLPFLGYVTKSMVVLFTLPKLLQRLNYNESMFSIQNAYIKQLQSTQKEKYEIAEKEKRKFDLFYVELENKFRGSRQDIKERIKVYLPYLAKLPYMKEDIEILDIGCGRGEWLEILSQTGYKAKGIDLNRIMVTHCQELGLDVQEYDMLEYLQSLEDNSLSVITAFHVIEHLPYQMSIRLYEEAFRVLKPEGMVIFETPNPENILVGAHYFYKDPTHLSPIVPETTQFILEQIGFSKIEIKRLHKYSDFYSIDTDIKLLKENMCNEMDYSAIGYKL